MAASLGHLGVVNDRFADIATGAWYQGPCSMLVHP
jgi:hypothetical protein